MTSFVGCLGVAIQVVADCCHLLLQINIVRFAKIVISPTVKVGSERCSPRFVAVFVRPTHTGSALDLFLGQVHGQVLVLRGVEDGRLALQGRISGGS